MSSSSASQKILILAYDFPPQMGGVATYSYEMALALHSMGHDVLVLTKKRDPIEAPFKVKTLSLPNSGILSTLPYSFHIKKHIKSFNPHKIICTLWMPDATACYLALKTLPNKAPYTIVTHGMEIIESKESLKKRLRAQLLPLKKKVFSSAHKHICVSQYTKDLLISHELSNDHMATVIHNGVNPDKFQRSPLKEKTQDQGPQLLSVSRLVPHKGIDHTLKALPKVIEQHPQLHYHIVGHGPDRERLSDLIQSLNLEKSVTLHGAIDHSKLNEIYSLADLFVLLSRPYGHHIEGFGLVFLEAALHKVPSLGGRSGGIPDAILEDKTGWLVDPLDIHKIENKITELLSNPQRLHEVGEQSYQYTLKHRTWKQVAEKIMTTGNMNV